MVGGMNPDLLFPEILIERAARVSCVYSEGMISDLDLDRVTLFVTHRCNLSCDYCNGPHVSKSLDRERRIELLHSDMGVEQYIKLLRSWVENGLRNIHFTGGEATLNPNLPEFIWLASEEFISSTITTNGTAPPELYEELIENGLTEIRISIDSIDSEEFDRNVGVRGSFTHVEKTIESIVDQRDRLGQNIYLVLNACVGSFNIEKIKGTLRGLIDYEPDAIKFLVIAEDRLDVQQNGSREFVNELIGYVRSRGRDDELLERKINSMFRKSSSGLKCEVARKEMKQCFVPLTERTLDSQNVYPCSIYLRYFGTPVIGAEAGFEEQQEAINRFVRDHDCRKDPICIDHCVGCCKEYNIEVNSRLSVIRELEHAKNNSVVIDFISQEVIDSFEREYEKISNSDSKGVAPFAIVKPEGIVNLEGIKAYFEGQGVNIVTEHDILDWQNMSLYLYYSEGGDIGYRIAKNKAHAQKEENCALFLGFEEGVPEQKLSRIKRELRSMYGEKYILLEYDGQSNIMKFNCIHMPDFKKLEYENKVVKYFLG